MEKSCEPNEKRTVTPSMQEPEVTVYEDVKENEAPRDAFRRVSLRSSSDEPEVSYSKEPYSDLDGPLY
ncbi:MAG: hypothetical protein M1564_02330 [Candidatus Marsarchaeota archaeon]|jgi:hypothetical protein|nr:hypothetical protein [Candidatus Marsarchaeota archaeon]MCL5431112.1 hypothetical protein [Candidatus Marsarchaeota archaeon]